MLLGVIELKDWLKMGKCFFVNSTRICLQNSFELLTQFICVQFLH